MSNRQINFFRNFLEIFWVFFWWVLPLTDTPPNDTRSGIPAVLPLNQSPDGGKTMPELKIITVDTIYEMAPTGVERRVGKVVGSLQGADIVLIIVQEGAGVTIGAGFKALEKGTEVSIVPNKEGFGPLTCEELKSLFKRYKKPDASLTAEQKSAWQEFWQPKKWSDHWSGCWVLPPRKRRAYTE